MSLVMTMLITPAPSEGNPPAPDVPANASYTSHAPISINGNAAFATKALVETWPGDGSAGNPYIIQGYDINASSANGIEIDSTTVHFIIRNCYVHDGGGSSYHDGIYLYTVSNGIVSNNTCSNDYHGIYLYSSSSNNISNNTCSSNGWYGIYLGSSSSNTINSNNCSSNYYCDIYLYSSSNNTLSNNTCSNSFYGICLWPSSGNTLINNTLVNDGIWIESSSGNTLINNTLVNDGIWIESPSISDWNTHSIDTSNTVNGKPVRYYKNQSGITIPAGGAGQVILANCTDFVIENQNLSETGRGIAIAFSSNIIVMNNSCSNSAGGIYLASSSSNTINSNNCSSNSWHGIYIDSSSNNTISNNNCSDSSQGIYLCRSSGNTLINNTCSNNDFGISLEESSSDNILSYNNCSSNSWHGIYLGYLSNNNTIAWNQVCSNTLQGVYIQSGSNNMIWNNTFIGNNGAGSVYDINHIQAYDGGAGNRWNSSGTPHGYGNYWSDWQGRDFNMDGIQDAPYNITGFLGAKDFYPLATFAPPIPEFSELIIPIVGLMLIALIFGRTRKKP